MSSFYKFDIIAETGELNLSGIEDNPSINDAGNVAFVGQLTTGGEGIFVGNASGAPTAIANTPSSNPGFSRGVQINNENQVVGQLQRPGPITTVYVWDGNNPGSVPTLIATGGQEINFPLPPLYDFDAVFSHPSINNNGDVVFSSIEGTTRFLATDKLGPGFYTTPTQVPARPMIADNGQIVVRLGNQLGSAATNTPPSPIKLFSSDFSSSEDIATASMGFTQLGMSPGMSDDAQIVTFYGDLNSAGASTLKMNPGPGIFASIKTTSGRVIERIAGIAGNGFLDPGETFTDINNNGTFDPGETDIGPFSSFDANARVGVNSTQDTQRAVTVVYIANDIANDTEQQSKKGIYTNRLNFFGTDTSAFDADNPARFTVGNPTLVVEQGDSLDDLGNVQDLNIYDPVNNRDRGDVAFWVSTTSGNQAVVRARPQEVVFLDFNPKENFKIGLDSGSAIFADLGIPLDRSWSGNIDSVFSTLAPNRTDLNVDIIRNDIVAQVQQAFDDININVKVLDSGSTPVPTNGRFTHVYIGDGPYSSSNPRPLNGQASDVDLFNQDLFTGINNLAGVRLFNQDAAIVFVDSIFRVADFLDANGNLGSDGILDGNFKDSAGNPVELSQIGEGAIAPDQVVDAIANIVSHEIGHSLGLLHLDNNLSSFVLNERTDPNELRTAQSFAITDQPIAAFFTNLGPNVAQNDQQRLAFTVGSDIDEDTLPRSAPNPAVLARYVRSSFSLSASLSGGSVNVSKAAIGIVPLGEEHIMPELIDLGSGDLATLLNREIEVRNGDKIFLIASTDGNGIDIFSVANGFSGNVGDIDLTNGLLVLTDNRIQGNFVSESGQPITTSVNLFQQTNAGFVQIGGVGAANISSNNPPVANDDKILTILEDAALTPLDITTPTDADGNPLTITVNTIPDATKGVVRLADGTAIATGDALTTDQLTGLVFAPLENVNGTAGTFSYTVSDGQGGTDSQVVTLEITPVNDAPIVVNAIANQTVTEDAAFNFSFDANTFSDVDAGDSLSYSAALANGNPLPSWLSFDAETRTFSGTPTNNDVGTLSVKVTATDIAGATSEDTFDLEVFNVNDPPITLIGTPGDDILTGGAGNDKLRGKQGNDTLVGNAGNDILIGGMGNDILTGGAGADRFFRWRSTTGVDTITDFQVGEDTLYVSASGFGGGLVKGSAITAAEFTLGSDASNSSDRFVYDQSTGALFFDADGTGSSEQIQIAQLSIGLAMTNTDIFVFA